MPVPLGGNIMAMTDREKYERDNYMRGWDACLRGKDGKFLQGTMLAGFQDCNAGKPLPYWYQTWVNYRNRRAAYFARRAAA